MEQKLVSIIMPNYNSSAYICECIDSVLQQSYSNFEFIIVDDGSTDSSKDLILSYNDKRIKPIFLKKNNQICNALNKGLSVVKGDYIARIDSDDIWHPEKLKKQIDFLESHEEYKICFSHVNIVDCYGNIINNQEESLYGLFHAENISQKDWLDYFLRHGNRLSHPFVVFSKEVLSTVGGYNYYYLQAQDYDLWLRAIIEYPFYIYPEELVNYRWDNSTQKISRSSEETNIRFYNEMYLIKSDFFSKISIERYKEFFGEYLLDPNAKTEAEILYEKAMLLLTRYQDNKEMKLIWLELLNQALQHQEILQKLQRNSSHTLKDLYQYSKEHLYYDLLLQSQHYQQLLEQIKQLQEDNIYLHSHIDYITEDLHNILHSSSWKITKPLRALKGRRKKEVTKSNTEPRFFLLGTENYGNLGDHKIAIAEIEFLNHYFPNTEVIEIVSSEYFNRKEELQNSIYENDIIIGTGGGNLGNQYPYSESIRRDFIQSFPNNQIIIFPQTVYFTKDEEGTRERLLTEQIYKAHQHLMVVVREQYSYDIAIEMFSKEHVILIPDIVLFSKYNQSEIKQQKATLILRSDIERVVTDSNKADMISILRKKNLGCVFSDTQKEYHFGKDTRDKEVNDFLNFISKSRIIITDRLHGMIFAILTGTPCIVFTNYNQKVKGTYEWIKDVNYIQFIKSIDNFESTVDELLVMDVKKYNREMLINYYDELANHI
jgi:exopolysaccharide biosynthesis predicted pyruvyltransferase EpsI/glycosyltransferase involved in cell wall biosynthesis